MLYYRISCKLVGIKVHEAMIGSGHIIFLKAPLSASGVHVIDHST